MSNLSVRLWPETIRFLTFTQINAGAGNYVPIGQVTASATNNSYAFLNPIRVFHIEDTTDQQVWYSLDGINDHYTLVSNSFLLIDVCSNRSEMGEILELPQGTTVYVRYSGGAPLTTGGVYLSVSYAK